MYPSFLSFLLTHLPGRLAPEPEWQVRCHSADQHILGAAAATGRCVSRFRFARSGVNRRCTALLPRRPAICSQRREMLRLHGDGSEPLP
jgi:hypothetical protein